MEELLLHFEVHFRAGLSLSCVGSVLSAILCYNITYSVIVLELKDHVLDDIDLRYQPCQDCNYSWH